MIALRRSTVLWLLGYLLVATAPLIGGLFNLSHGRGFWLNFSSALGFVALSMFAAQFALGSRIRVICGPLGIDGMLSLHKHLAWAATAFALAHPLILMALDARYWPLLNVLRSPLRAKFAVLATVALLALVLLSAWRKPLGMRYPAWKASHWLLGLVLTVCGLAHASLVNYYLQDPVQQLAWLALSALFVLVGLWVRVLQPLLNYHRRWRIVALSEAPPGITNLTLELVRPASYGRKGFCFQAGQFAWIMAGRSPFALTYHPFSLTSSAEQHRCIAFSIRARAGFSAAIGKLRVGDAIYVDGPHGNFVLDAGQTGPLVLVAAGVGVTPFVSMLATLADRGSRRKCHLWLASHDAAQVACAGALRALEGRLDLQITHVFSHPADASAGQRLDDAFIARHLPAGFETASYYICGPQALMDATEASLLHRGVPSHHIHTERFEMA